MTMLLPWLQDILFQNGKTILIVVLIVSFVGVFEYVKPAREGDDVRSRVYNLSMFVLLLVGLLALPLVSSALSPFLPASGLIDLILPAFNKDSIPAAVGATLIYAVVWDFFQYWIHRAQHHFPRLWVFHRVHHSDTTMNASTSLRQSLGSVMLGYLLGHIPTLLVCGNHLLPYWGSIVLFGGWGYLNHANIRLPFGRIGYLVSGPQFHALHHGMTKQYYDCNFAAFFPWIDVIFGTCRHPEPNEWPATGILDDTTPTSRFKKVFIPWSGGVASTTKDTESR